MANSRVQEHEETVMAVALETTNVKVVRYLMALERKIERLQEQIDRQEALIISLQDRAHSHGDRQELPF